MKANYYGDVGLQVYVNPANVIAVPTIDSYGKMRCCEYFPVAIVDFDENGDVIAPELDMSNDIAYFEKINYDGEVVMVDYNNYEMPIVLTKEQRFEQMYEDWYSQQED